MLDLGDIKETRDEMKMNEQMPPPYLLLRLPSDIWCVGNISTSTSCCGSQFGLLSSSGSREDLLGSALNNTASNRKASAVLKIQVDFAGGLPTLVNAPDSMISTLA